MTVSNSSGINAHQIALGMGIACCRVAHGTLECANAKQATLEMTALEYVQEWIQILQTLLIFVLVGASVAAVGCARAVTASLEMRVNRNAQAEQRHLATTMALAPTTGTVCVVPSGEAMTASIIALSPNTVANKTIQLTAKLRHLSATVMASVTQLETAIVTLGISQKTAAGNVLVVLRRHAAVMGLAWTQVNAFVTKVSCTPTVRMRVNAIVQCTVPARTHTRSLAPAATTTVCALGMESAVSLGRVIATLVIGATTAAAYVLAALAIRLVQDMACALSVTAPALAMKDLEASFAMCHVHQIWPQHQTPHGQIPTSSVRP
jgi:hypothetical protein